jgi:hypothetical protein
MKEASSSCEMLRRRLFALIEARKANNEIRAPCIIQVILNRLRHVVEIIMKEINYCDLRNTPWINRIQMLRL